MLTKNAGKNYRTTDSTLSSKPSAQSNSHMSLAARAGEMQIFSSDILYQVNGQIRRQQPKKLQRPREPSSVINSTNELRLNHYSEEMNTIKEKVLLINSESMHLSSSAAHGRDNVTQHAITTLKSQINNRMPSISASSTLPRDFVQPPRSILTSLQGSQQVQRFHPQAQSFSEYMSNGSTLHSRNTHQMAQLSNGRIQNQSSVVGKRNSQLSRQEGDDSIQNLPIVLSHIGKKHLKIEVQSSQQHKRSLNFDLAKMEKANFTPNVVRRSVEKIISETIEGGSFELRNPSSGVGALSSTATAKIHAAKFAQEQLHYNKFNNGSEPNLLPKMAGMNIERKASTRKALGGANVPLGGSGSLSQIQNGQKFGRGEKMQFEIAGASMMNRNQHQRDSSCQVSGTKEFGLKNINLRTRMPELNTPTQQAPVPSNYNHIVQTQVTQQKAELQINSPRYGNQILKESSASRAGSYNYIYDFLFVQVTQQQYELEYARRIRISPSLLNMEEDQLGTNGVGVSENQNGEKHATADKQSFRDLSLNKQQVFFSPQVSRNSQHGLPFFGNPAPIDRSKLSSREHQLRNSFQYQENCAKSSKVMKMKRNSIRMSLERALQITQFDGLKVLSKESILEATKLTVNRDEEDAAVDRFLHDVGKWLQDQNQHFKVTVKKKYINDILMQSKGAQNLAQQVVVVITRDKQQLQINQKTLINKANPVKRNLSNDASTDDEQNQETKANERGENETQIRRKGQVTPHVTQSRIKALQTGRRGYESENESKSFNSTTASSTYPNLQKLPSWTKQQNTPRIPRQISPRILVQGPMVRMQHRATSEDINGKGVDAGAAATATPNPTATLTARHEEALNALGQRYQVTKIKIIQDVNKYRDHADHPINKMLQDYNEFTKLLFRTRSTEEVAVRNIPHAIKLGMRLGIQLTKAQIMPARLKTRENSNAIKERLVFYVCKMLRQENEFMPEQDQTSSHFNKQISVQTVNHMALVVDNLGQVDYTRLQGFHYKCYVGKGNNQMTVRALFKSRFWWLFSEKDEPEKVNFFWTQLRKISIMNSLACKFVNPKDLKQRKHLSQTDSTDPSQGLGQAHVMNSALISGTRNNSLKKRKLSSPNAASILVPVLKQKKAKKQQAQVSDDENENQEIYNKAMTILDQHRSSKATPAIVVPVEDEKVEITPIMFFSPQEKAKSIQTPAKEEEETKKEAENAANKRSKPFDIFPVKLANKIENNYHLCNKKALFVNMKNYYEAIGEDPFDSLPVTFHIKDGLDDPNFLAFKQYYEEHSQSNNIWITKPGECTNQGKGIQVAKDWYELQDIISESTRSSRKTCIVQKYIHNPLLISRRKFDIRTFCMVTNINGNFKAYYYAEGYLRTSCREFSLHNLSNRMVHLTNDAVQKKSDDYGKFEPGNKLSYPDFQNYIDKNHGNLNVSFDRDIIPQIKKLTTDCIRGSWGKMDPYKRFNTFECFGLDFMIDDNFKVFLIEVNTNPCLELSSPLLARMIPSMLENVIRLAVDPIFPPPENFSQRKTVVHELCPENKFTLIFDEKVDGPELREIWREKDNVIIEIDEEELSDADIDGNKEAPDGKDE